MSEASSRKSGPRAGEAAPAAFPVEAVRAAVEGIRFGVVQLIIQDGRVVQIDKTEKVRLA